MALDSTFSLFNWCATSIVRYKDIYEDRFWNLILRNLSDGAGVFCLHDKHWITLDGRRIAAHNNGVWWSERFSNKWVILSAPIDIRRFIYALNFHYSRDCNIYKELEALGIYFFDSNELAKLDGGSFCTTQLLYYEKELVVDKSILIEENESSVDAVLKLRREAEFIENLPEKAKKWFPKSIGSYEGCGHFHYKTQFIHAYTLSEKIIHGSLDAYQVISILENIISSLVADLYCLEHTSGRWTCQEDTVFERAKRRFTMIENSHDLITANWRSLINSETVIINGKEYAGWPTLRNWIEKEKPLDSLLRRKEKCHGDLIFDDILFTTDSRFYLLDPNGDATSRFYDLGKLSISLLSGYELLKYNRFGLEYSLTNSGTPIIELFFSKEELSVFHDIASNLPKILSKTNFCSDVDTQGIQLLVLNGIHNASLPYFHLLQHRNQERSLAFFAYSIIRLNQALRLYDEKGIISMEEAIEACCNEI